MKIFEEVDAQGNTKYKVTIGGKVQTFPSREAREKFLLQLWLDWLMAMLRSQLLLEALEWLWREEQGRQADIQEVMEQHFATFVTLLLSWDSYFCGLPQTVISANQAYLQAMARDFVEMALDLILQAPPVPVHREERGHHHSDKPRG